MKNEARIIDFYPTLDSELLSQIEVDVSYNFSFEKNNEIIEIPYSIDQNIINLKTEDSYWNSNDFDLTVLIKFELKNLKVLFGENGVAPSNSSIGFCCEWYSAQSKFREVVKQNQPITKATNFASYSFEIKLPKKTFLGSISITFPVYLKGKDNDVDENELFLNNEEGFVLGVIEKKTLYVTGNGSAFPIKTEALRTDELWTLVMEYDDAGTALFNDSVAIVLNTNSKDYPLINPNDNKYCEKLADEVICNATILFLLLLKEKGELDGIDSNCGEDSILGVAKYFRDQLGIDLSSTKKINDTVRKLFRKGE